MDKMNVKKSLESLSYSDIIVLTKKFNCGYWMPNKAGKIKNLTKNEEYDFNALPDFALEIIDAGGLLSYIKQQ